LFEKEGKPIRLEKNFLGVKRAFDLFRKRVSDFFLHQRKGEAKEVGKRREEFGSIRRA